MRLMESRFSKANVEALQKLKQDFSSTFYIRRRPFSGGRQRINEKAKSYRKESRKRSTKAALLASHSAAPLAENEIALVHAEDKWIQKVLTAKSAREKHSRLQSLHQESLQALQTQRMPTTRNEEYRYTDISSLLRTEPRVARGHVGRELLEKHKLDKDKSCTTIVLVNGALAEDLCSWSNLPEGAFVGSLQNASQGDISQLGAQSGVRGGPFAILNGAMAADGLYIFVPAKAEVQDPIHVLHVTADDSKAGEGIAVSSPRLLVSLGKGASCTVVEEFVGECSSPCFSNAVTEVFLEEESSLKHGYVELSGEAAWQAKATLVSQAKGSSYRLTEAQLGGRLTRHDLSILQEGANTETAMHSFLLCGPSQLHDLHSKLQLQHPGGIANQLHKCIVSASTGRGVFDGSVKVERHAQQTDAAQLSRNLLLAPKATVNVKPNLQIVADDVKCSHGCAVSDLEEDQLFYFRTRGIDRATARQVLVHSFGSEVTQNLKHSFLQDRIQARINATLALASFD